MAITEKSDLRLAELIFSNGALASIQLTYFDRLEKDGTPIPGTFNNRIVALDPTTEDGKKVVALIGEAAIAGIEEKDEALQAAYQELDLLRTQLANRDGGLQQQLDAALAESNRLKKQISDFTAAIQPSQG